MVLKKIFVNEDVFFVVRYVECFVFVMLEEFGMKNEDSIIGYDVY